MKKTILTILVLALTLGASAQKRNEKQGEKIAIGIKVGGNLSQYHYYPDPYSLNSLGFDSIGKRLNPMFGLNVEIPLLNGVVLISPEVLFDVRGDSRLFNSSTWNTRVVYRAKVNYLEARLPIAVTIPVSKTFRPYLFAAPSFSLALPSFGPFKSEIKQFTPDTQDFNDQVAVDSNNMASYDYGVVLGVGLRFKFNFPGFSMLLKVEGGYYNGFRDTFAAKEAIDQVGAQNVNAYNIDYIRQNRGFEAALTIAIPLDFHPADDCFYWSQVEKKKNKNRGAFGF